MRLSLSAFPALYSRVIMAQTASTMYFRLMGRLSKVSSSFGANLVSIILHGSLILSRKGFKAKATIRCWSLCLPCFFCQGSKQFASLTVLRGRSNMTFPSKTSDFMLILATVRFFLWVATFILPDPFRSIFEAFLIEIDPFADLITESKRDFVVAFILRNTTPSRCMP